MPLIGALFTAAGCWSLDLRIAGLPNRPEAPDLKRRPDLRLPAVQTEKSRGISHLLIGRHYPTSAEMRTDPARCGLRPLADRTGDALYKIQ